MASRQTWRKIWWQVHKWLALALMIVLIPLSLTGALLAWDDAVDHAINPARYAVTGSQTLTLSAYTQAARRTLGPDDRIMLIRLPLDRSPVTVVAEKTPKQALGGRPSRRAQRITLWLDPPTGRLLSQERGNSGLIRIAHTVHSNLFLPEGGVGRAIIGLLGVAMFLLAATGVWIWWPQIGRMSQAVRWHRGDRRFDTNLHHSVGFWIALPLAFQAFTGVWIAWPQMLQVAGISLPPPASMGQAKAGSSMRYRLTPDQAFNRTRTLVGNRHLTSIAWPSGRQAAWRVSLSGVGDVIVDDATGVAKRSEARGGLAVTMRHLHDGTSLGWGWRLLMLMWGLAPTVLGVTGLLMWLRGRRWRAKVAHRRNARPRDTVAAA